MAWVEAFHIIFMVTWFAGLCLLLSAPRPSLAGCGSAARGASPRALPLTLFACCHPWQLKQTGVSH